MLEYRGMLKYTHYPYGVAHTLYYFVNTTTHHQYYVSCLLNCKSSKWHMELQANIGADVLRWSSSVPDKIDRKVHLIKKSIGHARSFSQ